MYPAFVNCTTIDWFSEWPQDALLEVAEKYLESMELGDEEVRTKLIFKHDLFFSLKLLFLPVESRRSIWVIKVACSPSVRSKAHHVMSQG